MRRRFNWDKKYLYWGLTAFCVAAALILFYFAVRNLSVFGAAVTKLVGILAPFIWGLVISYLIAPMMNVFEKNLFLPLARRLTRRSKKSDGTKLARGLSVLLAEIVLIIILVSLVYLILPQLLSSIQTLVQNSGTYAANLSNWADNLLRDYPEIEQYVSEALGDFNANVGNWLETKFVPQLGSFVSSVTTGVYGVARAVYNLVIGIIVSV